MSEFFDDIARGCLPTGEPLENLYGVGWWTEEDEPETEPDPAELKPCPFCGGKAVTNTFFDDDDLECTPLDAIDDCEANCEVTCENERCINGWWLPPENWNTRPIEDELRKRIAELEAERLELRKILGWAYDLDEYKDNPEERER